jgi:hypothetical protein
LLDIPTVAISDKELKLPRAFEVRDSKQYITALQRPIA